MDKPVIILGGGIWGTLLAYRLKEALPEIEFKLYEATSALGNHKTCTFSESDCEDAMTWLDPLISNSWSDHQVKLRSGHKHIKDPYHLIDSDHLHRVTMESLGENVVKLNNKMSMELALKEGEFVIDARNICHYKKTGYRKYLSLEVELEREHGVTSPVIYDGHEELRNLHYLPLTETTLLITDYWYSDSKALNTNHMRGALSEFLEHKGWKLKRVIKETIGTSEIPMSHPRVRQEGRVINLAGIFHDTTGCSIPLAVKLIDRMVRTSFRFGELKEVVSTFRKEAEHDREFLRYMNRLLIEKRRPQIFEAIYSQPQNLIKRFSRGELNVADRYRIKLSSIYNSVLFKLPIKISLLRHSLR
jgi:lycopene beta-cyclase